MRGIAFALAAATLAAGCVTPAALDPAGSLPPLSAAIYTAFRQLDGFEPSFDGTPISYSVYLPDAPEGSRFPVIVNFSPYWGNAAGPVAKGGDNMSKWLINHFAPRGYAVALVSVRGTGESGGCFEMGGLNEMQDTALMTEWLATQDWSNGRVGAIAKSYDGTSGNMAAVMNAKGLATIVPVSGAASWYEYLHNGGMVYNFGAPNRATFITTYTGLVGLGVDALSSDEFFSDTASFVVREGLGYGAKPDDVCPHLAEAIAASLHTGYTGDYTDYWVERNYYRDLPNATASLLLIHGLQDWNVQPSHIAPWYNDYPGFKKAILGQWTHRYPARDDWQETLLRWFDHELKGIPNGARDGPAVEVQADDCVWRTEADWPPTRADVVTLHPTADGGLLADGGTDAALAFTNNPAVDPRPGNGRNDHLEFVTEPLTERMHLSGAPELRFTAVSNAPVTAFSAALYQVTPEGEWLDFNWGYLHSAHRNTLRTSEAWTPGEPAEFVLRFFPQDSIIPAGSRLGLVIASGHVSTNLFTTVNMPLVPATNTVTVGEGAVLTLQTLPDITRLDPQPVMRNPMAYPYADFETADLRPLPCLTDGPRRPMA